jgi:ABC-2 type transport system permease protein
MRAELAKLRILPLPRILAAVAVGLLAVAAIVLAIVGPDDPDVYEGVFSAAVGLPTAIGGLVLSVWFVGLEYAQGTMRRLVAVEPRRNEILAAKLGLALATVALATLALLAAGHGLALLVAGIHDVTLDTDGMLESAAQTLVFVPPYTAVAFGLALLTRSMAGGITIALVITLVVDSALSAIPAVGDYTFGSVMTDLAEWVSGSGPVDQPGLSAALVLAWIVAILAPGWLRFVRSDVV